MNNNHIFRKTVCKDCEDSVGYKNHKGCRIKTTKWLDNNCKITIEDIRANDYEILHRTILSGCLKTIQWLVTRFKVTADDIRAKDNYAIRTLYKSPQKDIIQIQ